MENKSPQTIRSVTRNVIYGFSTWLLPIGLSFYAIPKILSSLGEQDYGIYALVLGFVGYSFNFSFGRSITKYIAEFRASGEEYRIPGIVSSALYINILVGLSCVAIMFFSTKWLVADVFKIDVESQSKTVTTFYLAAWIIFVSMQNQVFSAILQGIHRFDVYSKILNFNNLGLIIGNLLLAMNGFGLIGLILWNLFIVIISGLIYAIAAKRLLPEFKLTAKFEPETVKLIVYYSAGIIGYQILANLLLLFERGLITRQLGVANLTYYVITMTITLYIHGFVSSLIMVIFPLASELKNDKEKLLRLYTKATKIVCLIVFFFGATLITESRFFLTLWMGADFADKAALLLVIHTITFSLLAILTVSWQMTEGLGYPSYNFYFFVICLIISVLAMILLGREFGAAGIAFGRMTGFSLILFSIFYIEKRFFLEIQKNLWLRIIGTLIISGIFSSLIETIILKNSPTGWATLISATLFGGIIYGFTVWIFGYISEDEKFLFRQLIKIQPKKLNE